MKKRILAFILTVVMVLALVPTAVFAEDTSDAKTLTVGKSQTYTTVQDAISYITGQEDPTNWTIVLESGTYSQFVVPVSAVGLTVKAADDADVTIETWTGTPTTYTANKSYEFTYAAYGIYIATQNVTLSGLKITVGDWLPDGVDTVWYRAGVCDLGCTNWGGLATGLTIENCTFENVGDQGYVTTYPTGTANYVCGVVIGSASSWTVNNCSFDGFSSALSFMCDGYYLTGTGINVTNNKFTNCDRAMDGYYGGDVPEGTTAGKLTFENNEVTGSSALRAKIVICDQTSKGSIGEISVKNNTFSYTMVLVENMAESSCIVNDILSDNSFSDGSYYVEGDGWYSNDSYNGTITVNLPDAAYYEAPEGDTGYWVLNIDLDELTNNSEGANDYVQSVIDEANENGSHTISFTWLDTAETDLLWTVTAFKDCIYWVSGTQKESEPGLDKVIVVTEEDEDGNEVETELDQDDVAAGDTVNFKLTSNVPSTLDEYIKYDYTEDGAEGSVKTYIVTDEDGNPTYDEDGNEVTATYTYTLTFHDVMDEALELNEGSFSVSILKYKLNESGAVTEDKKDVVPNPVDVTSYATITTTGLSDGCTFEVTLDLLALYAKGIIDESDFGSAEVVVTYSATLSVEAEAGAYYNTAWVSYPEGESEKDKVEVDTYGIKVFKYDQEDETIGLEGAEFKLVKLEAVTVESDDDGLNSDKTRYTDSEGNTYDVYSSTDDDGNIVYYYYVETNTTASATSDSKGYATFDGLDTGVYNLYETEAPEGYVCSDTPVMIYIIEDVTLPAYGEDGTITNADQALYYASVKFANAEIPSTGGAGTVIFTVVGAGIIAVAGVVLVVSRRKHEDEE